MEPSGNLGPVMGLIYLYHTKTVLRDFNAKVRR